MTDLSLPAGFGDLEPFVADWVRDTRDERYAVRLEKPIAETIEFYDAIAARAEAAMNHLDGFELASLPDPEERLLKLLYSMILCSYAVNVFKRARIPDSGTAYFDAVVEPRI